MENTEDFDTFYEVYPRHIERDDALRAYKKALQAGFTPMQLFDGAAKFAASVRERMTEQTFIPYPGTWLRKRGFLANYALETTPFVGTPNPISACTWEPKPPMHDSRPIMWWLLPKPLWKSHWKESDIPKGERARA